MDDWWAEIENDVFARLKSTEATPPSKVGRRLGISEGAAVSLLSLLATDGKVRICLVELGSPARCRRLIASAKLTTTRCPRRVHDQDRTASPGNAFPVAAPNRDRYSDFTRKWSRRFSLQHASFFSVQSGRSSP